MVYLMQGSVEFELINNEGSGRRSHWPPGCHGVSLVQSWVIAGQKYVLNQNETGKFRAEMQSCPPCGFQPPPSSLLILMASVME